MLLIAAYGYDDICASPINRDLMVYHEGQYKTSFVYGLNGKVSQVTSHLENEPNPLTARTATGAVITDEQGNPVPPKTVDTRPGAPGANVLSDLAVGNGQAVLSQQQAGKY